LKRRPLSTRLYGATFHKTDTLKKKQYTRIGIHGCGKLMNANHINYVRLLKAQNLHQLRGIALLPCLLAHIYPTRAILEPSGLPLRVSTRYCFHSCGCYRCTFSTPRISHNLFAIYQQQVSEQSFRCLFLHNFSLFSFCVCFSRVPQY
jgi:hypothetical protein